MFKDDVILVHERTRLAGYISSYPVGIMRWLLRLPVLFYRMGLGWLANTGHIMILTTRGRKSGEPRHVAVEYRTHGSKVFVVSGWGTQPQWYRNVLADPNVTLQMGDKTYAAQALVVDRPGEALRVLNLFRRRAPFVYDPLIAHMSQADEVDPRTLPDVSDRFTIVRFNRLDGVEPPLPTVRVDLAWVMPVSLAVSAVTLVLLVVFTRARRETHSE
jgi:deazaflavin-dependent oxidoreductase (nitroreductase family)